MYNKLQCLKKFVTGLLAIGTAAMYFFASGNVAQKKSINYGEYIKKKWVAEDWHGENYLYNAIFSFRIFQVEEDMIKGTFATQDYNTSGRFTGNIVGHVAE